MSEGAFSIEEGAGLDDYNIKPRADLHEPIPQEQRELQRAIYRTRGILKLLEHQEVFRRGKVPLGWRRASDESSAPEDEVLKEFKTRLLQIARTGLADDYVRVAHATEALEDLRRELLTRKGNTVKFRYLARLAGWAAGGLLTGWLISAVGPWPAAYGLLVMGAVVGAWLSVAATRWSVALDDLPDFLDSRVEPFVRMLFVIVLALALGVALQAGLLELEVLGVNLDEFTASTEIALVLGLVTGIGERALATRFIERVRTVADKK